MVKTIVLANARLLTNSQSEYWVRVKEKQCGETASIYCTSVCRLTLTELLQILTHHKLYSLISTILTGNFTYQSHQNVIMKAVRRHPMSMRHSGVWCVPALKLQVHFYTGKYDWRQHKQVGCFPQYIRYIIFVIRHFSALSATCVFESCYLSWIVGFNSYSSCWD